MTPRQIAALWLVGLAGMFLIIWDHGMQTGTILQALGVARTSKPLEIEPGPTTNVGTNGPMPMAGNEFGPLATYGTLLSGDVQPNGVDTVFGNIWPNLG